MRIFLSRLHFPLTTLGLGRRVGIWFQGCGIRCPGCVSADTWEHGVGETTVAAVMDSISPWLAEADGVTISGGEPFEQLVALEELLAALRGEIGSNKDVLLYSGRSWESIAGRVSAWPGWADVVISEPFLQSASQTMAWRGSDNQTMHLPTELGESRYAGWIEAPRSTLPKVMDVFFENDSLWMAGIPEPGGMEAMETALADAGYSFASSRAARPRPSSAPLPA
jgi:anaerobic ribonucleoside-triphosphate reductase activating protein